MSKKLNEMRQQRNAVVVQAREVRAVDVPRDVLAVEHRAIEILDGRVAVARAGDEVRQILIDEPVGADLFADFLLAASVGDQLF